MKFHRLFLLSWIWALLLSPFSAYSQQFDSDLYWFKNALLQSNFSQNNFETYLNPLQGPTHFTLKTENAPWAGNYFPMKEGGLAQRWKNQTYHTQHSYEDLSMQSEKKKNTLSPIEKYDLWVGNTEFQATQHELLNRGPLRKPKPEIWEGFCNGVRCASILMPEPKFDVEVTLKNGTKLTFEPADLKALAGASYFYVEKYSQIGAPTREGKRQTPPNAAVFDLALRYYLGHHKKGFVIDSHLGDEIWNEAIVGFDREVSEAKTLSKQERLLYPQAELKREVVLDLIVLGEVNIDDSNGKTQDRVSSRELTDSIRTRYTLFLDAQGNILDGEWAPQKGNRGVDFAWFPAGRGADARYHEQGGNPFLSFKKIKQLFQEAVHPSCRKLFL